MYTPDNKDSSFIGKRIPMIDAKEKVMGVAQFVDDLEFPHMLYGKILRSPHSHARILRIDTSKAEQLPGIKAVVTSEDTPLIKFGYGIRDQYVFAHKKVRYVGEEVAAVAAVDPRIAHEAVNLIQVEYEELPSVYSVEEALSKDAPLIHENSNTAYEVNLDRGNLEEAWKQCDIILEEEFNTSKVHPGYIEPQGCIAMFDHSDRLHVYVPNQIPARTRNSIANALNIPTGIICLHQTYVGGAFGGKTWQQIIVITVSLAKKAGYPVKIVYERSEDLATTLHRVDMRIRIKMGAKKDGEVIAKEMYILADNGAYSLNAPAVLDTASTRVDSMYKYKNIKTRSKLIYTNKTPSGMYRGFGNPQGTFVVEVMMDKLANELGLDPVKLRLKNAIQEGDVSAHGWKMESCELSKCIKIAAERINWHERKAKPVYGRGVGMASVIHVSGNRSVYRPFDGSTASIKLNEDGEALISLSDGDIGQGINTVSAQIAADTIGIPLNNIRVNRLDTDKAGFGLGAYASRVTILAGNAVKLAAEDVKSQLISCASHFFNDQEEDFYIKDGVIRNKTNRNSMTVGEAVQQHLYSSGGQYIVGHGSYIPTGVVCADANTKYGNISSGYSFGCHAVEVKIDILTGKVKILRYVAVHDSGLIVNPLIAKGQVAGGIAQGLGYALFENMCFEKGIMVNQNLLDYKLPTSMDVPEIECHFVKGTGFCGPLGVKGLGEPTIVPVAPAISNAIFDAIGVRLTRLPFNAEKVREAMNKQKNMVRNGTL